MTPLDPEAWSDCPAYLRGIQLFNLGRHWEAHEEWEQLWHAAGRRGPLADFLKALIKLAAAAVKAKAGVFPGVVSHARRAGELLASVADRQGPIFCGLELKELLAAAHQWAASPELADVTSFRLHTSTEQR
jgi:predicted metal-dependent hydrolase